ncbi:MAG: InlB B-repeat-containing protein [Spirochaetia bacterium]|nr:InlB B-repeat-containing protein [Spirochaetia bacterium]
MMKKTAYKFTLSLILAVALMFSCGGGGGGGGVDNAIEDNSFSIGYNANGAESGETPASQNGSGKEALSVSANTGNLAKGGYLFDGWNTSADGSGTDYAPGALYNGKNITLYAKWAAIFNVQVINPGSPAPALDGVQRAPGLSYLKILGLTARGRTLPNIIIPKAIDGYTVSSIGDNAFQDCSNLAEVTIPETVTEIGDSAFSGCSNLSEITMQGTTPPTVGANAFDGCVQLAVNVPQSAASAYTSDPNWSTVPILAPNTFSILYNGNGSDGGIVPSRQVEAIGSPVHIHGNDGNLTRAGCTFNGWNTKADGTGNSFAVDESYDGPEDMLLYAQWTHPDYIVTFNGNGADTEASPGSITVKAPANTISSLPATLPTKNGYHFVGWYTQAGGTGDPFVVGSQVISSMTVYAKWSENDYTVSYNRNNATGGSVPASHATKFNQSITLHDNTGNLVRTGYRFEGWNTMADGSGTDYAVGASYKVTGDATLYAKWVLSYSSIPGNRNDIAVGDIVLADGKTATTVNYTSDTHAAYTAASGIPVGVVAYVGTAEAGEEGTVYMVGLNQSSLAWALYQKWGWSTELSTTNSGFYNTYTIIQNLVDYSASNYPAFGYAIDYNVTGYTNGWFVPSLNELSQIHYNRSNINDGLTAIIGAGGTTTVLKDSTFWSSSQSHNSGTAMAYNQGFYSWDGAPNTNTKDCSFTVRVVHALDD